jgi:hypothetical protein
MFDNKKPTEQESTFFVREAAETETAVPVVEAFWMCNSKTLSVALHVQVLKSLTCLSPTLGGVSKYGYSWDLKAHREGVSMVVNNLNPEKIQPALWKCRPCLLLKLIFSVPIACG